MSEEKVFYYIRQWVPQLKTYVYLTMTWPNGNGEWTSQESHSRVHFVDKEHAETVIKHSKWDKAEAFTDRANRYIQKRNPSTVRLIKTDDWEAIVIDNKLVAEGHRFHTSQILEILKDYGILEYIYESHYDDEDESIIQDAINQYNQEAVNEES